MLRWLVASIHLLALGVGLGAVWVRGRALRHALDDPGLKRVFSADNYWALAAILWIGTGLWRAFGGLEKGTDYYMSNPIFHAKIGLLVLILALEAWPMVTLIKWRVRLGRGLDIDTSRARTFAAISAAQTLLVIGMAFLAAAMARGFGAG